MNSNYLAFFLISFVPLIIAYIWYRPNSFMMRKSSATNVQNLNNLKPAKILLAFLLSFTLVYGYINLIIHQMGFYELFFTDIMKGSEEAKQITSEFLSKYGNKHRHFGHGVFHGAINAFVFALPFIGFYSLLEERKMKNVWLHFSYLLSLIHI